MRSSGVALAVTLAVALLLSLLRDDRLKMLLLLRRNLEQVNDRSVLKPVERVALLALPLDHFVL